MWIHEDEVRAMAAHAEKFEKYMMFHFSPMDAIKRERREEHRKWAIIKVAGKEKLAFVHRVTKKAYKADLYKRTWMEIKVFTFIRWARPMDL